MFTGLENPTHILLLLGLVLLFFGAKRLPEIGRSLGTGMREFKDGITGRSPASTAALTAGSDVSTAPAAESPDRKHIA